MPLAKAVATSQKKIRAERSTTKRETIAEEETAKAVETETIAEDEEEADLHTRRPLIDCRVADVEEEIMIVAEETKIVVVAVAVEEMVGAVVDAAAVSVDEVTVEIGGHETNTKTTTTGRIMMILYQ